MWTQNRKPKVNNKFPQITVKADADKGFKFTSLAHHINEELLWKVANELKPDKAMGIDNISVAEYLENGKANIESVVSRMKDKTYRPKPVKRVYIPKPGKDEKRPLGIPATEDKLVQLGVKHILDAIFEPDFLDCSHGFRLNRSCHTAIDRLDKAIMTKPIQHVVEVDIRKFFDNVNHYWLLRCLEERISDPNFLWLIRRFLKAGVMEHGMFTDSNSGCPQGGIVSPILANIYLHYVLDLWFEKIFRKSSICYMEMIRYCDDFVVLFESKKDASRFLKELEERLAKFSLKIAEDKTRMFEFGLMAHKRSLKNGTKLPSFNFLGFTHYCRLNRLGKSVVGHKTNKDNLRRKLREMKEWVKAMRIVPMGVWMETLKLKLKGHYNYFGVSGNYNCIKQYYYQVVSIVYKWVNRRSQKKSFNWQTFGNYLKVNPLPQPRIMVNLYTLKKPQ
jgi:RNA-directed DNA polymerase